MNDGEQDSVKSTSGFKLSATVPAFVPGIAYTTATSRSVLVRSSNLSPLVPEFHPSGSFTASVSSPSQHIRSKEASTQHGKVELQQIAPFQAHQTTFPPSKKNSAKTEKSATGKTSDKTFEGQGLSESTINEYSTVNGGSVSVSKKKKHSMKKQSCDLNEQQNKQDVRDISLTERQQETDVLKDVSSQKKGSNVRPEVNAVSSRSEQNCTPLFSTADKSLENRNISIADFPSFNSLDQLSNKNPVPAPVVTVSYSDKVKSSSLKNNNAKTHLVTEKVWAKDLTSESSREKEKFADLKPSSEFHVGQSSRTTDFGKGEKRLMKNRHGSGDSSWKTESEDSKYYKLKYGDSYKSQYTNSMQNPRTGKQPDRNGKLKKIKCDGDDNWRVKKDVDSTHATEPLSKSNIEYVNTESFKKRLSQQEAKHVDSYSKAYDVKPRKSADHKVVVDEKGKASKTQLNSRDLSSRSSEKVASTRGPALKQDSVIMPCSSQNYRLYQPSNSSTVAAISNKMMDGEFPDLKESVKLKKPSTMEERTVDQEDVMTSPKPSAPMSYSAVLRSAPPRKVTRAWENEHPTARGGLLKVPPQATLEEAENEADESSQKKKKKKKKKKKTTGSGEQSQESGSAKRTQKPIEFDLGVMLQTISKTIPDGTQQVSKKRAVATGVLPSQLSPASNTDGKPGVKSLPLKKSEKQIPPNKLDSTAPLIKRGKERETPARKKPSALKKIILKEREEKKKARETKETDDTNETCDGEESRTCESEAENAVLEEAQSDDDPDDLEDPEPSSPTDQEIAAEMHSRRFREYCFQVLDKEVDAVATELLRELVRFQDRQFHKDPVKAKAKRRFVLGLREVNKHLKLRKLKCVIISSNIERIKSVGGLDDTLGSIINLCQENQVPVVFALKRQLLGKVLLKKVPVSIVGIFNYDGAQEHFKQLIELTQKTRQAYTDKWQETREKLEIQQKETLDVKTAEMDKLPSAEVQQVPDIPHRNGSEGDIKNDLAEDINSSTDEDGDVDEEKGNDSDGDIEQEYVENALQIEDL